MRTGGARAVLMDLGVAQWQEGDVHWRKQLPYSSRLYAGDGFALVGDAGAFLDPFYSPGLDWMAFVVSFKGVFLEGLEVVFIVITFGLSATRYNPHGLLVASGSAVLAGLLVVVVGVIARRPLSAVPENTMKYAVGLLLTSFGTFWAVEGLGYFGSGESLTWPGEDWAILGLVVWGLGLSRLGIAGLRRTSEASRTAV